MITNFDTPRFVYLIVFFAICFSACKSKNIVNSEKDFAALNTKFDKLYIDACTQNIIGNYSTALSQFIKCTDIRPNEASIYFQISKIKQKLKEDNAAFQNASKANELAPGNKYYALYYASILKKNGNFEKAGEVIEIEIKSNIKDENSYNSLDAIYEKQNETDKRIALWLKYTENVGFKISTGQKLVALYKLKKDYISAHAMYDELKKAAPNKSQFYIEDAKLYQEQNDDINAIINFERAILNNPNNWDVNYSLYQYYRKKNDNLKATKYFKLAFEMSTVGFETMLPVCQQILKQVKTDTLDCNFARIAANGLIINYLSNANALFTSAELFLTCGNYQEALNYYQEACNLNPNLFDAWIGSMKCGLFLEQYDLTLQIGEKAMEYFPGTALLYVHQADASNKRQLYTKAYEYALFGEKFAFDDEIIYALYKQKGISLYYQKKYAEALEVFKQAITIIHADAELYDVLGNTYYYLKDENKAVENWTIAKNDGCKNNLIDKKIKEKKVYE